MSDPVGELSVIEAEIERVRLSQEEANRKMADLYAQQKVLLKAQDEEKRRKEMESPRELRVRSFDGSTVGLAVLPSVRPDILEVLRNSPGRSYDHYTATNRIHIDAWLGVRDKLLECPHTKLTYLLGVEDTIEKYLHGPEFVVTQREKFIHIEFHPKAITGVLQIVPGLRWLERNSATVPLSEGWRLIDIFENYTRQNLPRQVVWDGNVLALVQAELERRIALDKVALEQDTDLINPFKGNHELRPFQKVGVKFIQLSGGRALLADQMGLGKTWQAVAYALSQNLRTVVICPAHLKANWSREIYQLTGAFPHVLRGREPSSNDITKMLVDKPQFTIINYDILGFKTVQPASERKNPDGSVTGIPPKDRFLWSELLAMSRPDLVVLDEAHYVKNTSANRTKAITAIQPEHRLPMTGTPVLNRIGEYYSVLNWVRPDLFPSEERFYQDYTVDGKRPKNVAALRDILKPIMIRRLKKDVVSDLPPLNRITKIHELSEEALARYKLVLAGVYRAIDAAGNEIEKDVTSILVEIGKLKQVCADDKVPFTVELARELYETEDDADNTRGGHKKVLIFSQFKDPVYKIARELGEHAICWTGDTSMEKRNELEKRFQTDPNIHYLVVSLMTGQTGLNLTAAGHVIFNDLYWTPAAHAQAEERAYGRLSDMHGADSYYAVTQGTIEEWIQDLLQAKLALIENVVEGIDAERDTSIAMSIIQKLKEARTR